MYYYSNGTRRPEYIAWVSMKQRCYNPKNPSYKDYGARGICVCAEWLNSYETFFKDLGARPSANYSLDRREGTGNYTPTNCRWATWDEQAQNKRIQSNNHSGHAGVSYSASTGRWSARASEGGKRLALYDGYSFETALQARTAWETTQNAR